MVIKIKACVIVIISLLL